MKSCGFTIVEVMIALLIVGLGIPSIMRLQSTLFRGTQIAHQLFVHLSAFDSWRAQTAGEPVDPASMLATTEVSIEEPAMTVQVTRARFEGQKPFARSIRQNYTLSWSDILAKRSRSFVSFRFAPELVAEESEKGGK